MTSGTFSVVKISDIIINRDKRQRKVIQNIEELAESIRQNGLINPIVITKDMVLVAGERRLAAHKLLGFEYINAQFTDDLDPIQLHLIELEENIRRENLDWKDQVEAVAKYHQLMLELNSDWSQEKTADALNMSRPNISRFLLVKQAIDEEVPEVINAPKMSVAANFAQRRTERKKTAALRELIQKSQPAEIKSETVIAPTRYATLINEDFTSWAAEKNEQLFNFIHCDFPYGVNAGNTGRQSNALSYGTYEDTPDIFFTILDTLLKYQDNFIAPDAHMMFWFSMNFYLETKTKLEEGGWRVDPFPLVWYKSNNVGMLPDANRGPRRGYETAFHCSRGDRKIVHAVNSVAACATSKKYHVSEKPLDMLEHFFRMYIDETSVVLDPTCGSGNSVKIAENLGASWSLGIEKDEQFFNSAMENLGFV